MLLPKKFFKQGQQGAGGKPSTVLTKHRKSKKQQKLNRAPPSRKKVGDGQKEWDGRVGRRKPQDIETRARRETSHLLFHKKNRKNAAGGSNKSPSWGQECNVICTLRKKGDERGSVLKTTLQFTKKNY